MDFEAVLDERFDEDFYKIKGLYYLPWIGEKYINSKTRLLVLGESNPIYEPEDDENWIRTLITQNFAPILDSVKDPERPLVYLLKAVYNKKEISPEERYNLAEYMAFTNIVQRPLSSNKERPQEEDYKEKGWKIMLNIIKTIKPKNIVIIGVESIDYLRRIADEENIKIINFKKVEPKINGTNPREFFIENGDEKIKCTAIKHTSKYFSWDKWYKYICTRIKLKEIKI